MQVSKTLDYAVRSLTFMSEGTISTYSMKEISEKQHIPLNYLAKIMRKLVNRGIVSSKVGPEGGYSLRRSPSEINLRDVYEAIEGDIRLVDCMDQNALCVLYERCPQISVWDRLEVSMIRILEETSIKDMIDSRASNEAARGLANAE